MDAGIIKSFKAIYKQHYMQHIIYQFEINVDLKGIYDIYIVIFIFYLHITYIFFKFLKLNTVIKSMLKKLWIMLHKLEIW